MPAALHLATALLAASGGPPAAASAEAAVAAALAPDGARARVEALRGGASGCAPAAFRALRPVLASGETPLQVDGRDGAGRPCRSFAWAAVRVTGPALRTTRAVAGGEPLAGAVEPAEAERLPGRSPLAGLPPGARAARALASGTLLAGTDVRAGPAPGAPVQVVVRAAGLEITREARVVPCVRGRACALLPGGRRVEGRLQDGRILVEVP
ncbi:conserved hypothetical protein [Anaeromyxobacter sp. K]|uniref:hypothetical protein n=1 Tax=Anaeromyxobacter sp. (strain K) TaxID=447217 RepID=UPI00015F8E1B|nr:hypothetical protein [Anaeromyxobacter sp. K]ACG73732.1 conserved hypothetical protein [Anaeromyxobacter sp. K]